MKKFAFIFVFFLCISEVFSQDNTVWLHPNKGQWHDNILYQINLSGGKMYIEADGFKYHFYENPRKDHDHSHTNSTSNNLESLKQHVVKSTFIGSNWNNQLIESNISSFYENYFIGNDPSKWKSHIFNIGKTTLSNFYPSIDLLIDGSNEQLKYSFIVAPNQNPHQIKWKIEGANSMNIDKEGNLIYSTTLGEIKETKPIAWTLKNGHKTLVPINYKITHHTIQYEFPNGYASSDTLVIDPYLVFSTFTGSTTDNWGMTATPGPNGELYAGGISFGAGYPTTTGAFDTSYNGGTNHNNITGFDVAISKFSADGTQLLFSTYLGGSSNELPESMIATHTGDLYVMGITASVNFPLGASPYQSSFAGGSTATENSLRFVGSDIFVAKFNSSGTQLLASTYIGGSENDGLNTSTLNYNYGDQFRGEIILHGNDILVASHSRSSNFPITNTSSLSGPQDIVVFKMNANLSQLIWSSFYGGTGYETGNSIALSSTGFAYIAGGSSSADFILNGEDSSFNGDRDGIVLKINVSTGDIVNGTFIGKIGYDQCYFVSLDVNDEVYVFGQSSSPWAITPGKYGNPNSGQFIRKYDANLTTELWTTTIGAGTTHPEISPTAFLISDCFDIFFSGWGGVVNVNGSQAAYSSSNGFPVTSDAYQSTTNGSNFYLGILSQDATNLVYGTYMGGVNGYYNHVDGGTCRFDKSGAVYHAVCAACSGMPNGFTTTPGVWSTTNNSSNCNLAAFKFQMGMPYSLSANSTVCNGSSIQLNATGGVSYTWSPASSLNNPNIPNPIATPTETTVYYVSMNFNAGCAIEDSIIVEVVNEPIIDLDNTALMCKNDTTQLTASGGTTYNWYPNNYINTTTTSSVLVSPPTSMYYYVTVGNECFERTDSIYVTVNPLPEIILVDDTIICKGASVTLVPEGNMQPSWTTDNTLISNTNGSATATPNTAQYYYVTGTDINGCQNLDSVKVNFYDTPDLSVSPDTSICFGTSIPLNATGADSYQWSPTSSLTGANTSHPTATPSSPTTYNVVAIYGDNCQLKDSVKIGILYLPVPIVPDTIYACYGEPKTIEVSGAETYSWSPPTYLNTAYGPIVQATVYGDITYHVSFTNSCGTVIKDVDIVSISPHVEAFKDTIVCPGEEVQLFATGATYYSWYPTAGLSNSHTSSIHIIPTAPTLYTVIGVDTYGCSMMDSVFVDLYPKPFIAASSDQYLFEGDTAEIYAITNNSGTIYWSPSEYLSCVMCNEAIAYPPTDYHYTVTIIDENGCKAADDLWIYFKPLIYVPNTFTPNGDGFNNFFMAKGGNISDFEMYLFDRWGQLIFTSDDINIGWDGSYKGKMCQDGTYTWKIAYKDRQSNEYKIVGHVNLIR
ncbi:MAG: gliding motility-associated C-terminal domain-containing protein [Crocinitomicaceae bacterium]|nr:gliding motility-associated C-terminal domain-containing protein [Crocinitomicaceae bacterium]